ncbi:MAG: hypothetical protein CMF69_03835 [Magnetovibrio sp.]|nr:hypothetical protein [Magnetovibrio sp.]|tara:strand:- start:302 stop:2227 length:1926 start_codon:yes stop_codon:yes gene_type:complete
MHVFQNRGSLKIVSFVLACGIFWSLSVAAQQSAPVLLSPPKRLPNISPPSAFNLNQIGNSQISGYKAGSDDKTMASGIVVGTLQAVTANSVGTLTTEKGGLGQHMWQGVSIRMAENMLAKLPVRLSSATFLDLLRRIMLSSADPPEGQSDGESFAVLRIGHLVTIADYSAALTLLSLIPRHGRGEGLVRVEAETRLLSGDQSAACKLIKNEVRRSQTNFWQKALVFCQFLAKEIERAELGLTLLREVGVDDPVFFGLADAMFEEKVYKVESLDNLSPLILAMLAKSNFVVQPASILDMAPNALRVVASNDALRVGLRVLAVEKMAQLDMYSDRVISDLYKKIVAKLPQPGSEQEVNHLSALEQRAMKRAQFFATAKRSHIPLVKAEAASQAFNLASEDGIFIGVSRLFKTELEEVPVSNEMFWFAGDAYRAAIANGEEERGQAWVTILRRAAAFSDEKSGQFKSILPLAWILNEGDEGLYGKVLSIGQDPNKMVLLHALLAGLGYKTPVEKWMTWANTAAKIEAEPLPHVGIWFALKAMDLSGDQSSVLKGANQVNPFSKKRESEPSNPPTIKSENFMPNTKHTPQGKASSIMLIIRAMGGHDPHAQNPIILAEIIRSLYSLGLPIEGRKLALEAALGAGF